jgi:hypothetical protein
MRWVCFAAAAVAFGCSCPTNGDALREVGGSFLIKKRASALSVLSAQARSKFKPCGRQCEGLLIAGTTAGGMGDLD